MSLYRKRQSLEIGSYTVTASSENARFQWLLHYIRAAKSAGFLETLYQDVVRSTGKKRGHTYHIKVKVKKFVPNKKGDIGMEVYYLCQPNTYALLVKLVSSSDGNDIGVRLT